MEHITYGPNELKGRELMGEGYTWLYVCVDGRTFYCKVESDKIDEIQEGKPFLAYNSWVRAPQSGEFIYLPVMSMGVDPMFVVKANMFMLVHHTVAAQLDKMSKEAFSNIIQAKEGDVPKTPLKLITE